MSHVDVPKDMSEIVHRRRHQIHTASPSEFDFTLAIPHPPQGILVSTDLVTCVAIAFLISGLSTNHWFSDGTTHIGLWEWHMCEYLSMCAWLVLSNETFLRSVISLMLGGIILAFVALLLVTLSINTSRHVILYLVLAGIALFLSVVMTAFAVGIYTTGLSVLANVFVLNNKVYGYSVLMAMTGTCLNMVAGVMCFIAVCLISSELLARSTTTRRSVAVGTE